MVKTFLIITGICMIIATVLPFLRKDAWWVRLFDFPRPQITLVTALTLGGYLFVWRSQEVLSTLFLLGLGASFVRQVALMLPYTFLFPKQVQLSTKTQQVTSFRLVFANVLMENRESDALKGLIRRVDPDIMLFVETDSWWDEQLQNFSHSHPHHVRHPQENHYGMVLYSRLELLEPEVKFLVQADVPSIHTRVKLRSGDEIRLYCLHPRPPVPSEQGRSTERDAELLMVARDVKGHGDPAIVMGDLNDVAWSYTNTLFRKMGGLLDPRIGRGFYNSFNAKLPFIRYPLDHFFHSKHFRLVDLQRLSYIGSDHFPIMITLSYEPDALNRQSKEHAAASEERQAREKIGRVA
jgi:endonuclease/exonuclease/phosphatase (EEP) superfamily protein YafD